MFSTIQIATQARRPGGARDTLVVGQFQAPARGKEPAAGEPLDRATRKLDPDGSIAAAARRPEATGEVGRIVEAYPRRGPRRAIVVGLGARESFEPGTLRSVGAAVARRLAAVKDAHAVIDLRGPLAGAGAKFDAAEGGVCFGEGVGLVGWVCDEFRGNGRGPVPRRLPLALRSPDGVFAAGMRRGLGLANAANLARTLSETPPNVATPAWIAEQCRDLARRLGLECSVMSGKKLEDERMEGLITVGKASENKPCLIRLEYRPRNAPRGARPVVLVGKTMCYDSGGLSLKINNTMRGMKRDKDGGCAVMGAMQAIAGVVRPGVPVVALLACAENSISDEAYRPDDIMRYRNGVTVEVTNTDAEGRLVLADALCWACEKENPRCIIDLATLTGGVVVALGSAFAGMFCEDDTLRAGIERAATASGERVWRLPMHQDYRDMMKSSVADIINSNPNREAHPIQGAAFLSYFVDPKVPWCHLDIAGVHESKRDAGPFVEGPTGWGTRLLARFIENA